MEKLIFLLKTLSGIIFFINIITMIVLSPNWKYYKSTYKKFPKYVPKLNNNHVYFMKNKDDDGINIVWFIKENDFKLKTKKYIHNSWFTYFDPYTLYWLLKYKKWMKKNINLSEIGNYES
jgi:hypothetical protein